MARPVALITGASSGFGERFARRFAQEGYDLVLVARRAARLEALADQIRTPTVAVHVIPTDLSHPGAPQLLFDEIAARGLQLDALVNNAGLGSVARFGDTDPKTIGQQLGVNITALTMLSRLFWPQLISASHGILVNISSTASFQPVPQFAVYAASKAYVRLLGESLWQEAQGTRLRVLAIAPGPAHTEFFDVAGSYSAALGQKVTAAQVVDLAFRELEKDAPRPTVVVGAWNRFQSIAVRLLPTRLVLAVSDRLISRGRREGR